MAFAAFRRNRVKKGAYHGTGPTKSCVCMCVCVFVLGCSRFGGGGDIEFLIYGYWALNHRVVFCSAESQCAAENQEQDCAEQAKAARPAVAYAKSFRNESSTRSVLLSLCFRVHTSSQFHKTSSR